MTVNGRDATPAEPPGAPVGDWRAAGRALSALRDTGGLDLPLPGGGSTWARFGGLAELAAVDLSVARLAEGHADATAILAEAGAPAPDGLLGVWAADPPGGRVEAARDGPGWRLGGGGGV